MTRVVVGYLDRIPMVKVTGDLDRANGSKIIEWGEEALGEGNRLLLLDLTDCTYVDSGGLGSLFTLLQILGPRGILVVFGASPDVYRFMDMVGLAGTPALRIFSDEAAVRAALEGGEFKLEL